MPLNTIPANDFFNRQSELAYLRRLSEFRECAVAGNVLLEGARGMGKTELLKQLYRSIYWEEKALVPFYYSFTRANLKADHFAKDYFCRFVGQYLSFVRKDPALTEGMNSPPTRFIPLIASLDMDWMTELVDDFLDQAGRGDPHGAILSAISAPVVAARKSGIPVLIMLDDFHLSAHLFERDPGDIPGLMTLFEESMKSYLCPHILTGSPARALESMFSDSSLRGKAERLFVAPLSEDVAHSLFCAVCERLGIKGDSGASLGFMKFLGGNPLYIRNLAKAIWRMQKRDFAERDLLECYVHEVTEGETSFYWSSVLDEFASESDLRRAVVQLVMHSTKTGGRLHDFVRLSNVLGLPELLLRNALDSAQKAGLVQTVGGSARSKDNVLHDCMQVLYMREIEGRSAGEIRQLIISRYIPRGKSPACFEMVIPMASDAELVAAKAVEQICRSIRLDPDLISQIQSALIESCINAIEHSGSYDKKVFLRITASDEKLEIIIESDGKPFDASAKDEWTVEDRLLSPDKRGWGLDLMRKIMDDVKVERIDEKTRVTLIKNIGSDEVAK